MDVQHSFWLGLVGYLAIRFVGGLWEGRRGAKQQVPRGHAGAWDNIRLHAPTNGPGGL